VQDHCGVDQGDGPRPLRPSFETRSEIPLGPAPEIRDRANNVIATVEPGFSSSPALCCARAIAWARLPTELSKIL
jgi:hypothetical protein